MELKAAIAQKQYVSGMAIAGSVRSTTRQEGEKHSVKEKTQEWAVMLIL